MKNDFYKILVASAACLMLSASAPAQSESQDSPPMAPPMPVQADRGWSTKHLSATGRDSDGAVRATKLVGAQVNDISGHRVGQIQDIIVNPVSGRIDFALMSVGTSSSQAATDAGATNGKLLPVPWSLFRAPSSSAQYSTSSGQPTFTLNADQNKLTSAPAVDWSDLNQSEWRQRIYAYYGVTPQSSSSKEDSLQNQITGEGSVKKQVAPEAQPSPNP